MPTCRASVPSPVPSPLDHVRVGGVRAAVISRAALVDRMIREAPRLAADPAATPWLVFDCNGHGISLAARDPGFRAALEQADIVHADGGIVVAVSRLLSRSIPDRSPTTDLYLDSLGPAGEAGVTYFLLGGQERVNATCAERSVARAPRLRIVGRHHGYFSETDEEAIVAAINAANPDVLWVGLGKPKEQEFCARHRNRLRAGWLVTCGGLFNFVSGDYPRAPQWMRRSGMEWAHRMVTNPRKLVWRYLTTNPHALWLIATRSGAAEHPEERSPR